MVIEPSDEELFSCSNKFELLIDNFLTKTFRHYCILLEITDNIRTIFKAKLWRMGKILSKLGGPRKAAQLDTWKMGKQSTWNITINEVEVKGQLLRKRWITEDKLKNEMTKRRKLQSEVDALKTQVKKQAKEIAGVKYGNPTTQRNPKKSWSESSRQLKHKRKKKLANELLHATSFCEDNGFKPCSVKLENTETGIHETLDLTTGKFTPQITEKKNDIHSTLYIKDKYSISDTSYGTHQLQLKRDTHVLRVCRPRNPHTLLLHACTFVCFYLLHHEHVRKHRSYVCMYTRFFTHTHASHGVHAKCTQLHFIV